MFLFEADSIFVDELRPSPNQDRRRNGISPWILLMHYTGVRCIEHAIDWLSLPKAKVSSHYVIDCCGRITQMVSESRRAWHAGISHWAGEDDINSASIGIEVHNAGHEFGYPDFPKPQMLSLARLSQDIIARWNIDKRHVLAHSDVAPLRKQDPGEKFNWAWLSTHGVGLWAKPNLIDKGGGLLSPHQKILQGQELLHKIGYKIEVTGENDTFSRATFRAFQRHYRPQKVDGEVDEGTIVMAQQLLSMERDSTS